MHFISAKKGKNERGWTRLNDDKHLESVPILSRMHRSANYRSRRRLGKEIHDDQDEKKKQKQKW
jgi:hypothetical protein